MDERLEHLLRKVAQLRALAANAGTQAEAESAAAQADAIIAKYRLSEADVDGHAAVETCERQALPLDEGSHVRSTWRNSLAHDLAKHYGCYVYRHLQRSPIVFDRLLVVGRASDVAILRLMYAWLVVEIERQAQTERGRSAKHSFRMGAVDGFLRALAESTRAATANASAGAAMVLLSRSQEARSVAFASNQLYFTNVRWRADRDSYERGKGAGASLARGSKQLPGTRPLLTSGSRKG